ncbi:hypothetical protein EWI07_03085 [Sporolactobacillus sp. THM7-4]|nr:hypothetical protein EWI07_03085 [Sporolactobacillus sp. THM7-4]
MKAPNDLMIYDLVFPVFMFYFYPPLFGIAAGVDLLIDALVLFGILRFLNVRIRNRLGLLMKLWLLGLLADILGSLFLLIIERCDERLAVDMIDPYSIYTQPLSVIIFCIAILISSALIYWFDLSVLKKKLTLNQARRIALVFAIVTAPYTYLIPTSWLF